MLLANERAAEPQFELDGELLEHHRCEQLELAADPYADAYAGRDD